MSDVSTNADAEKLAKLDPEKVHPDLAARIRSYKRVVDNKASERAVNAHAKALVDTARVLGTDEPERPVRPAAGPPRQRTAKKTAAKRTAKKTTRSGS